MRKIILLYLFLPLTAFGQGGKNTCDLLEKINKLLQKEHYRPKPVDDSLAVFVFDSFMDELDDDRNLLTKSEYEQLRTHRLLIDNYLKSGDCDFFDEFTNIYKLALQRKKRILEKIRVIPLDYNSNDSIKFSKVKFSFELTANDFEKVWTKRIQFEILQDISKISSNIDSLQQHFIALEKKSHKKIFDSNICQTDNLLIDGNGLSNTLQNKFLNIFCTYFDPHSNYFSSDAKSSFLSMLSTSNLSLGFNVSINENQEIVVEEIVPGGPAAQSKLFEKGDLIIKVSDTKGKEYEVSCAALETVGELIFSDANKELEITLRKKNRSEIDVRLTKQILKASENSVYSFVVEGEKRTGYIKIPSFYADYGAGTAQGCALDVLTEVVRLNADGIDGLVIDLIDNGGGSMDEAIKLAGVFIEGGPVAVLSDRKDQQQIVNASLPRLFFNGPLVLLQNGNSASASELFAGMIQDYNRGIVIGAPSLGKASMQTFLPFKVRGKESFVKLTVQKFYRITGDSNQIKGVIPNVYMPVLFDSIIPREKSFKTALPYNQIVTGITYDKFLTSFNPQISRQSYKRVRDDVHLMEIHSLNKRINRLYSMPIPPTRLTFTDVYKLIRQAEDVWDKVKKIAEQSNGLKIVNTAYDQKLMESDPFFKELTTYRLKDAANNSYFREATLIIEDYLKTQN